MFLLAFDNKKSGFSQKEHHRHYPYGMESIHVHDIPQHASAQRIYFCCDYERMGLRNTLRDTQL